MHKALTVTQTSNHIDPTYAISHQLDRASLLHGLDLYLYIEKGLNNGRHPFPINIFPQKPKKVPQKVARSHDLHFAMRSVFDRQLKYQTVNYDQVFLKTWSRANRPPTLTCDSSRVTLLWVTLPRRLLSSNLP
jgi:hypothetical protein